MKGYNGESVKGESVNRILSIGPRATSEESRITNPNHKPESQTLNS